MAIGTAMAIGIGVSAIASGVSAYSSHRRQKKAEAKEAAARRKADRLKAAYMDMDTSNPYANLKSRFADLTNPYASLQNQYADMENTMEDLTVNQKQAEFEAQQFSQSQANILGNLRGAAGGSGIAALAQSLSKQGQIAAQRSAASIGQQESRNQMAAAQAAGRLQEMQARGQAAIDAQRAGGQERLQTAQANAQAQIDFRKAAGERESQYMEMNKVATALGMSQSETAAYMNQANQANQAKWGAIGSGVSNITSMLMPGPSAGGGGSS